MNCPYCKNPNIQVVSDPRERGDDNYAVCCWSCGLQAPIRKTEEDARAAFSVLVSAARLATMTQTLEANKRHIHVIPSEYGDRWIASTNGGSLRVSAETFDGVLLALGAALREAGE